MRNYINSLNEREKWMVIIAIVCLSAYSYYLLLYAPISNRAHQKNILLIEKTQTLEWMKKVSKSYHAAPSKEALDNSQLLTLIDAKLKDNEPLNDSFQLQQTASGEIQLNFDKVPFNLLIEWLAELNTKYQFSIKQFDATRSDKPGVSKVSMMLTA